MHGFTRRLLYAMCTVWEQQLKTRAGQVPVFRDFTVFLWSQRAHLHVVGMFWFMSDINQPSLPTPFFFLS